MGEHGGTRHGVTRHDTPVAIRWGSLDPAAPLIVLFRGDATETDMAWLARCLPVKAAYASIQVPLASILGATTAWFREWLGERMGPPVPVVLVGFGSGAAIAGGLLLADPTRFAAAVLLYGALPFDAGVPVTRARLAGIPVFLTHGVHDTVVPVELQRRTWNYLVQESGAPLWAQREATGHELTAKTGSELAGWITTRLSYLQQYGAPTDGMAAEQAWWPTLPNGRLPIRHGDPPEVSVTTPQQQESQNAPVELQEELASRIMGLDGVTTAPSMVSVPGTRAFVLSSEETRGPSDAFMVPDAGEFAHLHPDYDGSLHLMLPIPLAFDALSKGWAVAHPMAGLRRTPSLVMIFGPRDRTELEIVTGIVRASHSFATKAAC